MGGACFFLYEKTIKSHYQCTCIDVFRKKKYSICISMLFKMWETCILVTYFFRKMGVGVNTNVHLEKENVCTLMDK